MKKSLAILILFALPLAAQERRTTPSRTDPARQTATTGTDGQPDVLVDVPNLSVDDIRIEVQDLHVQVALDARVANLLTLNAGATAGIQRVRLQISGVRAEARLIVRLDKVTRIIERTLTTIDNNPQVLASVLQAVDTTVNTVGQIANTALQPGGVISQTVNTLGQTVTRTLDTAGNIVERTLDTAGGLVNERTVGRLLDLPAVGQATRNAAGQTVRQVRDTTGAIIELTLDAAGKVVNSRIVTPAGQR